jgi:ActR/RegA family two-component response regulator
MTWRPKVVPVVDEVTDDPVDEVVDDDVVRVYLLDRAGPEANAFGAKLDGRPGVELVGGADDLDDALDEILEDVPDVILVGTDFGGAGCVSAVETLLSLHPEATVVVLTTAADKALVSAAIHAGAVGSLDRGATPGETITALHLHSRRGRGEDVDMALAEPPAEARSLRVSGALPVFRGSEGDAVEPGVEATAMTGSRTQESADGDEGAALADGNVTGGVRAHLQEEDTPKKRGFRLFGRRRQKATDSDSKGGKTARRRKAARGSREAAEAMLRRDAEVQKARAKEHQESR